MDIKNDFQTKPIICNYMVSLLDKNIKTVLEPTPGNGNLVNALSDFDVTAPENFFLLDKSQRFDAIVMNPPFSSKSAFGVPNNIEYRGMKLGYHILSECMQMSNNIIALMPWFTLLDSDIRMNKLKSFGIKSLTSLPRKSFDFARIQTVIINLKKGYKGKTNFETFNF